MLKIEVKDRDINRAIKKYRRKHRDTKVLKNVRGRKEFIKPSDQRKKELKKAIYKEIYLNKKNNG